MKCLSRNLHLWCLLFLTAWCCQLPAADKPGRWRWLFNGKDTSAWRGYVQKEFPSDRWRLEGGCLHLLKTPKQGGELITIETFDNFEFEWEWKIATNANNGIKYFVTEARPDAPGHEYQMVDDRREPRPKHVTGAFYDVVAPVLPTGVKPPGQWNKSRLVVHGNLVEHWLNGKKLLSYEIGSEELSAALASSKFRSTPDFGKKIRGHLMLTNHHGETWYRKMRIRELSVN